MRWKNAVLATSLAFNLFVLAGFTWQRLVVVPMREREWAREALELTPEQTARLEDIRTRLRAEAEKVRDATRADAGALRDLVRTSPPDVAQMDPLFHRVAGEQVRLQVTIVRELLRFRDTLEPAQRERFNRLALRRGFLLRLSGLTRAMFAAEAPNAVP